MTSEQKNELKRQAYLMTLEKLNQAYDKARALGDRQAMLDISTAMDSLIMANFEHTNEVKLTFH